MAAATLTKGLPALLLPVLMQRWGWRRATVYAVLMAAVCIPFALEAGWGLSLPWSTTGLFGAIGIYAGSWNFNSGLFHWLERGVLHCVELVGAPSEIVGRVSALVARLISAALLGMVVLAVGRRSRRHGDDAAALLRLAPIPLGAYLLLTTTVHPWYVTLIVPLLPFLLPRQGETTHIDRFIVPGIYLSAVVALSYLTYLDPADPREHELVRLIEYVPLYLLLIWAAWPSKPNASRPDA
jgi:hypothetical protein